VLGMDRGMGVVISADEVFHEVVLLMK